MTPGRGAGESQWYVVVQEETAPTEKCVMSGGEEECLCGSAAFGGGNGSGCRVHGGATRETPNLPDKTIDDDWVPCFLLGGGCSWSDWVMLLVQRFILTCVCVIVLVVLLLVAVLMGCLYYYDNDDTKGGCGRSGIWNNRRNEPDWNWT